MSGVELKVVLVGGDEAEQRAFNRPFEDQQREAAHTYQPTAAPSAPSPTAVEPPPAPPIAPPVAAPSVPPPVAPPVPNVADVIAGAQSTQDRALNSVDELAKRIQDLIDLEIQSKAKPPEQDKPKDERPNTVFGRMMDRIDGFVRSTEQAVNKGMGRFGKTRIGKAVSAGASRVRKAASSAGKAIAQTRIGRAAGHAGQVVGGAAKRVGARLAASRAGQAVAGALGRTAATTAATNAAGAGAAGAAGAGAIGAIAAPVAVFTLAVGAAALTVKGFADAIHTAAGELEDLSPALASVRADFQVRRELQRLDRADRIGAGAAQLEAARGRINESMYEVQTKILELMLKFAPLIEGVLDGVNVGVRGVDNLIAQLVNIWAQVNDNQLLGGNLADNQDAADRLKKSDDALKAAIREFWDSAPEAFNGNMDPWLAEVLKMPGPGGGGAAPPMPPNLPGNFP